MGQHDSIATPRILIVDDDAKFLSFVERGLTRSGLECSTAASSEQARALLNAPDAPRFDAILLDVTMPEQSGWEFLGELRVQPATPPVIFVTARSAVRDRVRGLELGAEDYVIKPFAFQELLARIHAVLRRRRDASPILEHADLRLDTLQRRVRRGGVSVELSQREFRLLLYLMRNPGRTIRTEELLREVWDLDFHPGTNVLPVQIARLRRRLDAHGPPLIETVTNEGYRLADGVSDS